MKPMLCDETEDHKILGAGASFAAPPPPHPRPTLPQGVS